MEEENIPWEKVKEAKVSGFSDKDILDHISRTKPNLKPKIESALSSGYKYSDILNHISKAPSKLRSVLSAPLKGIVKGVQSIGEFAAPIAFEDVPFEQRQKILEEGSKATEKFQKGTLEKYLPTKTDYLESSLEKAGEELPSLSLGGGTFMTNLARSVLSGFGQESVKRLGGGPLAQSIIGMLAISAPDLSKKIIANKSQKSLVDFMRNKGFTEEEIAPLLPGVGKRFFFGKLAKKTKRSEEVLGKTRDAISRVYKDLEQSPIGKKPLTQQEITDFLNESTNIFYKIPASLRKEILPDYMDFIREISKGSANRSSLMNLWNDINYFSKDKKIFGLLKEPLEKVFSKDPSFQKDFEMIREVSKKFYPISKTLKPGMVEGLLDAGEAMSLVYYLGKMNFGAAASILGMEATRNLFREMLINPRLQNLHKKMLKAINDGQFSLAKKISQQITDPYQKKQNQSEESPQP